jgi:hypothetical protein
MSLEKFIEDQISKAMAAGEFDNLPGAGQPLDLSAYFQTPEHLRLCYSMLKSADFAPPEVELLKEIKALKERAAAASDEQQKERLTAAISEKTLKFKMMLETERRAK